MRDLFVIAVVGALTLVSLVRPDIGVLGWAWLGIFNPHRLAWDYARDLPVAAMVGGATLLGLVFYRGQKRIPPLAPVFFLLAFDLWIVVTHFTGVYPDLAVDLGIRIFKIQLMVFVTLMLLHSREHIERLAWVLVLSLGFFGVKGGIFTIATGGEYRVWGPEGTFIEGNNELALALIMAIPLMRYLQITSEKRWIRRSLVASMILCAVAALGSQSRGAFLAIAAMCFFLWWRGSRKLLGGVIIVALAAMLIAFMPATWEQRMRTIETYEQDDSAMERINAWTLCWNLALDHPFVGGGMAIYTEDMFAKYANGALNGTRNAHSIYFSVLGEHGFVGLLLFLGVWFSTWRAAGWIRARAGPKGELAWAFWLASMIQVSLVGYLVGGAFLYLAYFDLPYNLLILATILKAWVRQQLTKTSKESTKAAGAASPVRGMPVAS
jgi:probable O-glycosylation ligase (exosortase A-associated)